MPTNRNRSTRAFTTGRGANYAGGQQTFTNNDTGRVARNGRAVSRRTRYYDVRVGLGLAGG